MPPPLELNEVIGRANMGVSRPFVCKAGPEKLQYWVKGQGNGWSRDELCFEWIAARLAGEIGLPMATPALIQIPNEVVRYSSMPDIRDLGEGVAYGSQHIANSRFLEFSQIDFVPTELRAGIFFFDWWVQNQDRMLGELGGNVNLLWEDSQEQLTVIDHNNAFDPEFDESQHAVDHVFAKVLPQKTVFLEIFANLAVGIIPKLEQILKELPFEWTEMDGLPEFDKDHIRSILNRIHDWSSFCTGHQ